MKTKPWQPMQIAPGVHILWTGSNRFASNVYFVVSEAGWVLIDTGWAGSHQSIIATAASLFGSDSSPAAIIITHMHPDHTGSVLELLKRWDVPVYVHPAEVPQAHGEPVDEHTSALDRRVLGPLLTVLPPETMPQPDLSDVVRAIDPVEGLPGLPGWRCISTPGHTPGHIALYREEGGVLLSGDAMVTIEVNALGGLGLLLGKQGIGGPPSLTTWDRPLTEVSLHMLAELQPHVLAPGHGDPLIGPEATQQLSEFAARSRQKNPVRYTLGTGGQGVDTRGLTTVEYQRVAATRAGGPEVLEVVHRQLRSPRQGEVRVRVQAVNVSVADVRARQGVSTLPPRFPFIPGHAVVGEVDAVGQGVTDIAVGERVAVLTQTGGYSEYVYVSTEPLMPIPGHLDAAEAVVVALNYLIAHQTLSRSAGIRPGQKILITGAAGGVGTALVQLGRLLNLKIYGAESPSKHAWLSAQGVIPLDERIEDAVASLRQLEPEGIDVVLDGVGREWIEPGLTVLKRGGVLVEYANPASRATLARILVQATRQLATPGRPRITLYPTRSPWRLSRRAVLKAWATLYRLLETRQITPVIAERFPLVDAAQAHARLERGDVIGSLVLEAVPSA